MDTASVFQVVGVNLDGTGQPAGEELQGTFSTLRAARVFCGALLAGTQAFGWRFVERRREPDSWRMVNLNGEGGLIEIREG